MSHLNASSNSSSKNSHVDLTKSSPAAAQRQERSIKKHNKNKARRLHDAYSWYNSDVKERQKRMKKQMTTKEIYESLGYIRKEKQWILKTKTERNCY